MRRSTGRHRFAEVRCHIATVPAASKPIRRGAMSVMVAVSLIVLLVAVAFSVDVAYMSCVRQELRVASDSAAKAAVTELSLGGTQQQAIDRAISYAAKNSVAGNPLNLAADNVTLGSISYESTGKWLFQPAVQPITAARVEVDMSDDSPAGAVNLLFGRILGTEKFSPRATATAAFVRNKVCLCLDRSRSMTFDLTGISERWPASEDGYPHGVPSSARYVRIGRRTYDFRWLYPPCNESRWYYLANGVNAYLDEIENAPVETQVSLVTWASSTHNASSRDSYGYYHTYTGDTLNWSSSLTYFSGQTIDSGFVTEYDAIREQIASRGQHSMLGGTDTNSGLQEAIDLFAQTDDGLPCNKVIVLFSDGMWNVGVDPVTNAAVNAKNANIVIHTIGFMLNDSDALYGTETLQQIAEVTGGTFYEATDGESLQDAFEELARNLPVVLTE
ncbi:MAG: hypothetical protein KatS3mg111_1944 [Pirellulaceae bacterium]|nr:MAG: hypothetical protein KatS3mg111_1944 [Pirellulaceae bacterium]